MYEIEMYVCVQFIAYQRRYQSVAAVLGTRVSCEARYQA
jgi:hypothetical protein